MDMTSMVTFGPAVYRKGNTTWQETSTKKVRDAIKNDGDYVIVLDDHAVGLHVEGGTVTITDPNEPYVRVGSSMSVQREAHMRHRVLVFPVSIGKSGVSVAVQGVDALVEAGADALEWETHRSQLSEADFASSVAFVNKMLYVGNQW